MRGPRARSAALLIGLLCCAVPAGAQDAAADSAGRLIGAARDAARADRNAEAMRLLEQGIALAPSRRAEWLPALADQTTYAGRAADAVALYRESLAAAATPDAARRARRGLALALSWSGQLRQSLGEYDALVAAHPDDLDARLGRARVLSWMNRLGPARLEYAAVLARDPANFEARRELARVQSWRGKQRDAERRLAVLRAERPDDAETVVLLAQAQDWVGRPDRADRTLRDFLASAPGNERARTLLDELRVRQQPGTRAAYERSTQSDALDIAVRSFAQDVRLNGGRSEIVGRIDLVDYSPGGPQGRPVSVVRPGLTARHRASDAVEANVRLFADRMAPEGADPRVVPTYDAWVTVWPSDALRLDVGSSRTTFDNVRSLAGGVAATFGSLSADVTPDEMTRLSARLNYGGYTDGNARRWAQVEAERRVHVGPPLRLGARYTAFGFTRELGNGYFNPHRYQSAAATARTAGQPHRGLWLSAEGSYGREFATPGGEKPVWSAAARAAYAIVRRAEVEVRYDYFSSRLASSAGFSRGTGAAGVRVLW